MKNRVAVVTGSTSGIGLGIAQAFAAQGADVVLNGFGDPAGIEVLRRDLTARYHVRVAYSAADMSKPAEVHGMIEFAESELGRVDVLVNNAGIQHTAPAHEFPVGKWDAIIAINLSAAFHGIRAALPGMLRRDWGRIINIASVHGLVGSAHKIAYVAAKHGIVGITKVVALETARTGVTCNVICPGWVLTPLLRQQLDDIAARDHVSESRARELLLGEKQPSMDFATPDQIAALAVFLCSDAAAQIRGASLPVDGGWTAQ